MEKVQKFLLVLFVLLTSASFTLAAVGTNPSSSSKHISAPLNIQTTGGLAPMVTEHGKISWSIDANGSNSGTGTIQVLKPAGATVRVAYLAAASTGFSSYHITNTDISINGNNVTWGLEVPNSISSFNYWQDVTPLVKSTIDSASPGLLDLTVTEANPFDIEGETLVVIFDDPSQVNDNTIILAFGAQNTAGDTFNIGLSDPINKTAPGFMLDMSLGISFGFQSPSTTDQFSTVDINGNRLTSSAGGQDDGTDENGALITTGGVGDSNTNPADPNAGPSDFNTDDELYSLIPFVNNGDTNITAFTHNPSNDDNIYFAGFFLGSTTAVVGEGIVLSPVSAINVIGNNHTVTATVQDTHGDPVVGTMVFFNITVGPNAGMTFTTLTDSSGKAFFTYTGNTTGTDSIIAEFTNNQQQIIFSNAVEKTWIDHEVPEFSVGGILIALLGVEVFFIFRRRR